ncbi:hypothetical protein GW17_00043147 [Ensete ventricosum]|nr:hypothetical protein GW17_00043147 [Ensete ventricosum]
MSDAPQGDEPSVHYRQTLHDCHQISKNLKRSCGNRAETTHHMLVVAWVVAGGASSIKDLSRECYRDAWVSEMIYKANLAIGGTKSGGPPPDDVFPCRYPITHEEEPQDDHYSPECPAWLSRSCAYRPNHIVLTL